jgi:hypothetical protein
MFSRWPFGLKCAVVIAGTLFGFLCSWVSWIGAGVPMEWPR